MKKSSLWKRGTALALSLVLVLGMLPLTTGAGSVSPGSYLASSAYYGNKSKCKMDAAMAYGYAQAMSKMDSDDKAKLVDVAGDGVPILVTAEVQPSQYGDWFDFERDGLKFWTWNGKNVSRFDFGNNPEGFAAEDAGGTGIYIGTFDRTPALYVGFGAIMDTGGAGGGYYYKVKDGQMTLLHRDVYFSAWNSGGGTATGQLLPLAQATSDGWGTQTGKISVMLKNGWRSFDGGFDLCKVNDKYVSRLSVQDYFPYENSRFVANSTQIFGGEPPATFELEGTWSTASSLCSSLLAYVNATGDFVDVSQSHYAYDPVVWAVKEGITNGTSATTFSPDQTCTQGQILTFLWRAVGEPKAAIANPFTNGAVTSDQYYYNAMLWAYEQGIVTSKSLNPNAGCQRSDVALYLWRLAGSPAAGGAAFSDVSSSAPYAQAVAWAVREGITNGTSATTFSPGATCTRGQIVTFLYRDMA